MSEKITPLPELPPHVQGLHAAIKGLVDNPPAGFGQPRISGPLANEKFGYTSHTLSSEEHVPGYPNEPARRFEYQEGSDFVLAFARLPGEPLEDGTPTLRDYVLYSTGNIHGYRSRCPDPERIRNTASHMVGLAALIGGLGEYKHALTYTIKSKTEEWLSKLAPESLGEAVDLQPEEVEVLTYELQALAGTAATAEN